MFLLLNKFTLVEIENRIAYQGLEKLMKDLKRLMQSSKTYALLR